MTKRSPPMPSKYGSTRAITALVAIAASTALPPRSSIWTPARAASGWLAATMPYFVITIERPTMGRRERVESAWAAAVGGGMNMASARTVGASARRGISRDQVGGWLGWWTGQG